MVVRTIIARSPKFGIQTFFFGPRSNPKSFAQTTGNWGDSVFLNHCQTLAMILVKKSPMSTATRTSK